MNLYGLTQQTTGSQFSTTSPWQQLVVLVKRQLRQADQADGNAKLAIVMLLTKMPAEEAKSQT